jgi:ABC-type multidrug transport system ATPase subunit
LDIIKITNLTKKFDKLTAVEKVSFAVKKGEVFGFLGPNGVEKQLLLKCLQLY